MAIFINDKRVKEVDVRELYKEGETDLLLSSPNGKEVKVIIGDGE